MIVPAPAPDGETYLSTKQAATYFRVTPGRITQWRYQGLISPLAGCPPWKPMYPLAMLIAAEHLMRAGRPKRGRRADGREKAA